MSIDRQGRFSALNVWRNNAVFVTFKYQNLDKIVCFASFCASVAWNSQHHLEKYQHRIWPECLKCLKMPHYRNVIWNTTLPIMQFGNIFYLNPPLLFQSPHLLFIAIGGDDVTMRSSDATEWRVYKLVQWPFKTLWMLFEVVARFASVTVKEGIQTRRSGINRLFTPSVCLTLSRATILYLRLLSCYHIRSEVSDKCLCLPVFCPSLFAALSSNISFGSAMSCYGIQINRNKNTTWFRSRCNSSSSNWCPSLWVLTHVFKSCYYCCAIMWKNP